MDALEEVWGQREETVYGQLFGDTGKGIYVLDSDVFLKRFKQESLDPRWLHHGVFQCSPNTKRKTWLYVSSGMSNPWEKEPSEYTEEEYSGLGVEFVMETPEESSWAIRILQDMVAYNILLSCGRMGEKPLLDYGDRIPLKNSITPDFESKIRNLIITKPSHYQSSFVLKSGKVDFLHFLGITDAELVFGKSNGSDVLVERLKQANVYPLTDPCRESALKA